MAKNALSRLFCALIRCLFRFVRHCASHFSNSNMFHFAAQLPLPKVIQQNVVDLCDTLLFA